MSSRAGDLDPGLVWCLAQTEHMSAQQFNQMANHQSGLLGVWETRADVRDLLRREGDDVRAADAVALFCYQVKSGLALWPPRSVGWTRSSSQEVSARTHP